MKRLLVNAGIQIDENKNVVFDWEKDNIYDILHLCEDTSAEFNEDNVRYVYGYHYTSTANGTDKRIFRNYLKGLDGKQGLFSEEVQDFVDNGVLRLEQYCSLDDFKATVTIDSTKNNISLVDVIQNQLSQYLNTNYIPFRLIKQTYRNVNLNEENFRQVLRDNGESEEYIESELQFTLKKFNELKEKGELFQIKRFLPPEIRYSFYDFLKFKTKEEEETYAHLQGVNVLIFDDFITSGATVKEIIRYLRSINDRNTLTVFVLVKQQ